MGTFSPPIVRVTRLVMPGIYPRARCDPDSPTSELVLSGSLENAQERKADALISRAKLSKHHRLLDIGFGWGGISIR